MYARFRVKSIKSAKNDTNQIQLKGTPMKRLRTPDDDKNIIAARLKALREYYGYSQRDLADQLQLANFDVDKNMITRIETNNRYVSDFEIKALAEFFDVSYSFLLDGALTEKDRKKHPDLQKK